jgi:hypothetical protein
MGDTARVSGKLRDELLNGEIFLFGGWPSFDFFMLYHEIGCPSFRSFRKLGTTGVGTTGFFPPTAIPDKIRCGRIPWCPALQQKQSWGSLS